MQLSAKNSSMHVIKIIYVKISLVEKDYKLIQLVKRNIITL